MKRILVVEDEASIRELVALNLKMTGWEVLEAPRAERALELIQKNPPCDVALLDIMLPGMDGFSLCETIRHGDPYIGIIMASAKGQESDKIRGLSIGADDYITISDHGAVFPQPRHCPGARKDPGRRLGQGVFRRCQDRGCQHPPPAHESGR